MHASMTEDYGIPVWGSYLIFAIATIILGLLIGLVRVVDSWSVVFVTVMLLVLLVLSDVCLLAFRCNQQYNLEPWLHFKNKRLY